MSEQRARPWTGLVIVIIGASVLTAFAAWAPAAFRKLGLFAIAFGLGIGVIAGWTTNEFGLRKRVAIPLTVLLVFVGLLLVAIQGVYQLRQEQQAAASKSTEQAMVMRMLEQAAPNDPQAAADLKTHRDRLNPSFTDYLAIRTRPLGKWAQPWPVVFWGGELVLAGIAGVVAVRKMLAINHPEIPSLEEESTSV